MSFLQESLRVSGVTIRVLGADDGSVLENVAPDVFDGPLDPRWSAEFLADQRHHLAVALDATGTVVGLASVEAPILFSFRLDS